MLIGGWILSCYVKPIFHKGLTGAELDKIKILIRIMSFNMAISFPISVFGSVIVAHERYIYRQAINIFSTVAAIYGDEESHHALFTVFVIVCSIYREISDYRAAQSEAQQRQIPRDRLSQSQKSVLTLPKET